MSEEQMNLEVADNITKGDELTLDDLQSNWVKNPKVGEQTEELTVQKFMKNTNIHAVDKDGKPFKTNLSNVDYKIDIHTDKGIFSPASWEVWGKIKAIARKHQRIEGLRVKVKHVADGMQDKKAQKEKKCYVVTDLLTGDVY